MVLGIFTPLALSSPVLIKLFLNGDPPSQKKLKLADPNKNHVEIHTFL